MAATRRYKLLITIFASKEFYFSMYKQLGRDGDCCAGTRVPAASTAECSNAAMHDSGGLVVEALHGDSTET